MAKEKGEKTNLYLLSIVAIVAIVGIVVLILNSSTGSISLSSDDLSGEAFKSKTVLESGMTSVGTIILGTGSDAVVVSATDCGNYCDICECGSDGKNCQCKD